MDRSELAAFLRSRRERLRPEDVGLSTGPRRRVPGLRRDEVAALAGMSTDYYVRLEQGRGPQPSIQMLSALARSLRLGNDERDYLFRVAGQNAPTRLPTNDHVAPSLLRILDRLVDAPGLVLSSIGETLAQNRLAIALLGDQTRHTGLARSGVYRWFTDPAERASYPVADQSRQSRALVAGLRVAYGAAGRRSTAAALVRELTAVSPEFAEIWDHHDVVRRFEDHKTLIHPELGPIELDCQALFTEDGNQTLLVLTASPRTAASETLALLAVLGQQSFAPERDLRAEVLPDDLR